MKTGFFREEQILEQRFLFLKILEMKKIEEEWRMGNWEIRNIFFKKKKKRKDTGRKKKKEMKRKGRWQKKDTDQPQKILDRSSVCWKKEGKWKTTKKVLKVKTFEKHKQKKQSGERNKKTRMERFVKLKKKKNMCLKKMVDRKYWIFLSMNWCLARSCCVQWNNGLTYPCLKSLSRSVRMHVWGVKGSTRKSKSQKKTSGDTMKKEKGQNEEKQKTSKGNLSNKFKKKRFFQEKNKRVK